jgi:hypothetical protein
MSRAKAKLDEMYWNRVRGVAKDLESDGCSWASEMFQDCCFQHDIHYRLGTDLFGKPISRREADLRFRLCIQHRSKWGKLSPISWLRWAGVRIFGRRAYKGLTRS